MSTLKNRLKSVLSGMIFDLEVESVADLGSGRYELEVCNNHYLKPCDRIGESYEVESIDPLILESLDGSIPEADSIINLWPPLFIHGPVKRANQELIDYVETKEPGEYSFPFIYLMEPYIEETDNNKLSPFKSVAEVKLFFMSTYDPESFLVEDHHKNNIEPMRDLALAFIDEIDVRGDIFGEPEDFEIIGHIDFGLFRDAQGYIEKIFSQNISGVELRIKLPLKKICSKC